MEKRRKAREKIDAMVFAQSCLRSIPEMRNRSEKRKRVTKWGWIGGFEGRRKAKRNETKCKISFRIRRGNEISSSNKRGNMTRSLGTFR